MLLYFSENILQVDVHFGELKHVETVQQVAYGISDFFGKYNARYISEISHLLDAA